MAKDNSKNDPNSFANQLMIMRLLSQQNRQIPTMAVPAVQDVGSGLNAAATHIANALNQRRQMETEHQQFDGFLQNQQQQQEAQQANAQAAQQQKLATYQQAYPSASPAQLNAVLTSGDASTTNQLLKSLQDREDIAGKTNDIQQAGGSVVGPVPNFGQPKIPTQDAQLMAEFPSGGQALADALGKLHGGLRVLPVVNQINTATPTGVNDYQLLTGNKPTTNLDLAAQWNQAKGGALGNEKASIDNKYADSEHKVGLLKSKIDAQGGILGNKVTADNLRFLPNKLMQEQNQRGLEFDNGLMGFTNKKTLEDYQLGHINDTAPSQILKNAEMGSILTGGNAAQGYLTNGLNLMQKDKNDMSFALGPDGKPIAPFVNPAPQVMAPPQQGTAQAGFGVPSFQLPQLNLVTPQAQEQASMMAGRTAPHIYGGGGQEGWQKTLEQHQREARDRMRRTGGL